MLYSDADGGDIHISFHAKKKLKNVYESIWYFT